MQDIGQVAKSWTAIPAGFVYSGFSQEKGSSVHSQESAYQNTMVILSLCTLHRKAQPINLFAQFILNYLHQTVKLQKNNTYTCTSLTHQTHETQNMSVHDIFVTGCCS